MNAFLAAAAATKPTVWEKILAVPRDTWLSLLLGIAVIVLVKRVWKDLKEINDIIPWIALFTVGGAVLLYWTYERTEPRLLTPLIDKLAEVFPTKFEYKGDKDYKGPSASAAPSGPNSGSNTPIPVHFTGRFPSPGAR